MKRQIRHYLSNSYLLFNYWSPSFFSTLKLENTVCKPTKYQNWSYFFFVFVFIVSSALIRWVWNPWKRLKSLKSGFAHGQTGRPPGGCRAWSSCWCLSKLCALGHFELGVVLEIWKFFAQKAQSAVCNWDQNWLHPIEPFKYSWLLKNKRIKSIFNTLICFIFNYIELI